MKYLAIAAISLLLGATAQAAGGWHVFATGSDSSDYGAYASANADVLAPHALAIRASKAGTVSWNLTCESGDRKVQANVLVAVTVGAAKKCSLYGTANTDTPGKLTIQLLRR